MTEPGSRTRAATQRARLPYNLFQSSSRYQIQLGVRYRF